MLPCVLVLLILYFSLFMTASLKRPNGQLEMGHSVLGISHSSNCYIDHSMSIPQIQNTSCLSSVSEHQPSLSPHHCYFHASLTNTFHQYYHSHVTHKLYQCYHLASLIPNQCHRLVGLTPNQCHHLVGLTPNQCHHLAGLRPTQNHDLAYENTTISILALCGKTFSLNTSTFYVQLYFTL